MKGLNNLSFRDGKRENGILEGITNSIAPILFLVMALQVLKKVYLAPSRESDHPSDKIESEIDSLEILLTPQPSWWLRDTTILEKVDQIVFDPADILGEVNDYFARKGLPEELSGEPPEIDSYRGDLCPSRALSVDAMEQMDKFLDLIEKFEMETIVYYYQTIKPIGESPQSIRCTCGKCLETIQERFNPNHSILDSFGEALGGRSAKSFEEVRDEFYSELEEDKDGEELTLKYREKIDQVDEERRAVFKDLEDDYFRFQSELVRELNKKILQKIVDTTGASLRIVTPMMDGYVLVKERDINQYASIVGFSPEMFSEFEVESIYGREIECGGEIVSEFPKNKRGLYIYTGEEDDSFTRRFISQRMEGEEAFVFPEDVESLMTALKSLAVWGEE